MKITINGVEFKAEKYGYLYVNEGDGRGWRQVLEPKRGDGQAASITVLDEKDFQRKCTRIAKRWGQS